MREIEKKLYETFGIEKKPVYSGSRLYNPVLTGYEYPQITDAILLELIVILGSIFISVQDKETLKDHILNQCIMNKDVIKQKIQALI